MEAKERLTLTVEEAGELLGISRAFAYELVARGELPSLRLGRRLLVPRRALEALPTAASEPASVRMRSSSC
jgi:excisionase family DNA binding protein